jgi:hypothetical protein
LSRDSETDPDAGHVPSPEPETTDARNHSFSIANTRSEREYAIMAYVDGQLKLTTDLIATNSAPFFESQKKLLSDLQKLGSGAIVASFTLVKLFQGSPSLLGKIFLLLGWICFLVSLLLTMLSSGLLTRAELFRGRFYNQRGSIQTELLAIEDLDAREQRMHELLSGVTQAADAQTEDALKNYITRADSAYHSFVVGALFFVLYAVTSLF